LVVGQILMTKKQMFGFDVVKNLCKMERIKEHNIKRR
jgi:hypothetical protein